VFDQWVPAHRVRWADACPDFGRTPDNRDADIQVGRRRTRTIRCFEREGIVAEAAARQLRGVDSGTRTRPEHDRLHHEADAGALADPRGDQHDPADEQAAGRRQRDALPHRRGRAPIHYELDQPPWIASRMQDFCGLARAPTVGDGRVPLVLT
jgi:hypothetical protein